uniref:Uncharacterized protein n=1 Tax=Biomphalaria glabrata TaxID=6526 RepID=A0A2C9KJ91_BIOGL
MLPSHGSIIDNMHIFYGSDGQTFEELAKKFKNNFDVPFFFSFKKYKCYVLCVGYCFLYSVISNEGYKSLTLSAKTSSTGDSLDDEDDDEETSHDTKKNTNYNEGTGRHHESTHEAGFRPGGYQARLKEKRNVRSHMKGKLPKDKRKLREKRRSTGVVHCIPSTEHFAAELSVSQESLDMEDLDISRRNRTRVHRVHSGRGVLPYRAPPDCIDGELDKDGDHQNGESNDTLGFSSQGHLPADHESPTRGAALGPSDLEADLEDNQDYDSTVSHSETNLSIIGRSESSEVSVNLPRKQVVGSGNSTYHTATFSSKFSPESNRAQKFELSSDADSSSKTNASSASSCTSSFLSRYCDGDSPQSTAGNSTGYNDATPE